MPPSLAPLVIQLLRQHAPDAWACAFAPDELMRSWHAQLAASYEPCAHDGTFTLHITVSELPIAVCITPAALRDVYVPLVVLMHSLHTAQPSKRILIGFVASAGAGKTTFTQILSTLYARVTSTSCACVSMDAYHVCNAALDAAGLRAFKGRIDTIDAAAFARDLRALTVTGAGAVRLPVYDRAGSHDPVPDAMVVTPEQRIVLVEGLYLCAAACTHAQDGIPVSCDWGDVRRALDIVIALCIPPDVSQARVIARKVSCGRTLGDAIAHYARVDAPVATFVSDCLLSRVHGPDLLLGLRVPGGAPSAVMGTEGSASISLADAVLRVHWASSTPAATPDGPPSGCAVILGLNACVQRTLVFRRGWTRDAVNRADAVCVSPGGKGQHTAIAMARHAAALGSSAVSCVGLVQMLGGASGHSVAKLVADTVDSVCPPLAVRQLTYPLDDARETRTCVTLLDADMTECVEPARPVTAVHAAGVVQMIQEHVAAHAAASEPVLGVALMGTTPPGAEHVFEEVLRDLDAAGTLTSLPHILMDAHKGVASTLRTGLVTVLKVNAAELRVVAESLHASQPPHTVALDACAQQQVGVMHSIMAVFSMLAPPNRCNIIAVTHGAHAAVLAVRDAALGVVTMYEYCIPDVRVHAAGDAVLNPIGAGDTVAGVFLTEMMLAGAHPPAHIVASAFQSGLACASASVLTLRGAEWDVAVAATLRNLVAFSSIVVTLP